MPSIQRLAELSTLASAALPPDEAVHDALRILQEVLTADDVSAEASDGQPHSLGKVAAGAAALHRPSAGREYVDHL